MEDRYLILLSGGQDSVTCLFDLLSKVTNENICAISFIYDHKVKQCVEKAKRICKKYKINHKIFDLSVLTNLSNGNIVSARNMFFLSAAALFAKNNNYNKIVIGLSKDDFECYNDCKKEFIIKLDDIIKFAFESNIDIIAPLINKTKIEIWKMADELNKLEYIYKNTYSCWQNTEKECGSCLSCKIKRRSYDEYIKTKYN